MKPKSLGKKKNKKNNALPEVFIFNVSYPVIEDFVSQPEYLLEMPNA